MPPTSSAATRKNEPSAEEQHVKSDPIGSGPIATVYKGKHSALNIDTSIKELKDIFGYFSFLQRHEVVRRLRNEICAQAKVRHPNVVAILDQSTDVLRPFVVMERLDGSLRERIDGAQGKGQPVALAIRHFLQLAYALQAAHAQGLTHHNIKPENVLFDSFGNAKLGDFGMTRLLEVDTSKGIPEVFVNTGGIAYLPPELMGRAREAGPAADVYSLGILAHEMLTGEIPGRRSPPPSKVNKEVPARLDPIIERMTQDRLESRYPDIGAVLNDFYTAFPRAEYLGRGDLVLWSELPKA